LRFATLRILIASVFVRLPSCESDCERGRGREERGREGEREREGKGVSEERELRSEKSNLNLFFFLSWFASFHFFSCRYFFLILIPGD
jgi:hypothetical protein